MSKIPTNAPYTMVIDLSPNNNMICYGGIDHDVHVITNWRQQTKPTIKLSAHTQRIFSVHFFNNGHVLSGSGDAQCKLWDIEAKTETANFSASTAECTWYKNMKSNVLVLE